MNRKERRLAARAPGADPDSGAARLFGLAEAQFRNGRLAEADGLCARALAMEPASVPLLHLRARIALAAGRPGDAVGLLGQAVALAPHAAILHHALAGAHRALGAREAALLHYRRAAELQPEAATLLNLGNVLLELDRAAEAVPAYQAALRIDGGVPEIHFSLGQALAALGRKQAADAFARSIALRPDYLAAHEALVEALLDAGAVEAAWRAACAALQLADTPRLRTLFVTAITHAEPTSEVPGLRAILRRALEEGWTRPAELSRACCAVVALRPIAAQDELLRRMLVLAPICHAGVEHALTQARRDLLACIASGTALDADSREMAALLARQGFINEYAWAVAADEAGQLATLRPDNPDSVLGLAMYAPLANRPAPPADPALAPVLAQQIDEPAEEARLRAAIPRLTAIEDAVSVAVRAQYEEHPYPRWAVMPGAMRHMSLPAWLAAQFPDAALALPTGRPIELLVAGCGTGQHPIELARRFTDLRVLAIDLSLASLGYAARMAGAAGVAIEFAQADLLGVAALGRAFDVIESAGVLHHLADLWAGWRALLGVLRPGGVMGVALYTARGRAEVRQARDWIAASLHPPTLAGIRACRQEMMAMDAPWARRLASSPSFGATSACRDLLFHVHETAVTLPELAGFIAGEGLDLLGLDVPPAILRQFRAWHGNAGAAAMRDLALWDRFEAEHPAAFAQMVQLWVRKPPV